MTSPQTVTVAELETRTALLQQALDDMYERGELSEDEWINDSMRVQLDCKLLKRDLAHGREPL
jgi:hypothetical protein